MNQSFLFFELIGVFIVHWLILEPQTYVVAEQFGVENIPLPSARLVFLSTQLFFYLRHLFSQILSSVPNSDEFLHYFHCTTTIMYLKNDRETFNHFSNFEFVLERSESCDDARFLTGVLSSVRTESMLTIVDRSSSCDGVASSSYFMARSASLSPLTMATRMRYLVSRHSRSDSTRMILNMDQV